jgi:hypothetical protein
MWNGSYEEQRRRFLENEKKKVKRDAIAAVNADRHITYDPNGAVVSAFKGKDYDAELNDLKLDQVYGKMLGYLKTYPRYTPLEFRNILSQLFESIKGLKAARARPGRYYEQLREYVEDTKGITMDGLIGDISNHMNNDFIPEYFKKQSVDQLAPAGYAAAPHASTPAADPLPASPHASPPAADPLPASPSPADQTPADQTPADQPDDWDWRGGSRRRRRRSRRR